MQIQLANKLLWKKLFESVAPPSLAVEYKNKSLLTHPPFIAASPDLASLRFEIIIPARCGLAVLVRHLE